MKNVKKIASLLLALLLLLSMAACGEEETFDPNNIVEDTTTLDIMCLHKGYGFQWLTALKEGFEKANPGVEVKITTISKSDIIRGDIKNYKKSETDLYFDIYATGMGGLVQEYSSYYGGKQALRPLNEVMATEIPGEGITVADEDIEAEYEAMAKQYELEIEKIKGMVPTEEVKTSLETRKAVKVLVENAVPVAPKAKEEETEE